MARINYSRETPVIRLEYFGTVDVPDELLEDGRKFELADYISDHYVPEHEDYAPIEYDEDNPVATITRED